MSENKNRSSQREQDWPVIDPSQAPRYSDVATFMRTRRMPIDRGLDIALVGVPYDFGSNVRPGARLGPAAVREASRFIRRFNPVTKIDPFALVNVADVGDAAVNAHERLKSIDLIQVTFEEIHAAGAWPLSIGGDHTIPLPILRVIAKDKSVGVVQFDAHSDTLDEVIGTKINHATTWRRAVEEGLVDPKRMIQIGLRGSQVSESDTAYGHSVGMRVITIEEYEEIGRAKVIEEIGRVVGDGQTYVSFDIDGLDAACAIGTGVPEIGGLSPRDAQVIIRSLTGRQIIGADICEVAPMYDVTGHTQLVAANLMFELLCVMADAKAKHG
ncbi:agmatinase [Rhizobium mesoamericanum]|uniref:Agmatinase, mitochondrial n=1 Tax=Rhizobium mesoamericanum STM3625 TaxID=1211777 RepID=K0Q5S5_9HYPH|nr:agmatinase [Rhizobium mesoamericanum]CCM80257.1 Agmatinase, mitochondrial [Rhizobium mesoamericanum STM3625]